MIDKTLLDNAGLDQAVKNMAEVLAEIGFDKAPANWTKEQIYTLAEVAAEGFIKEAGYVQMAVPHDH